MLKSLTVLTILIYTISLTGCQMGNGHNLQKSTINIYFSPAQPIGVDLPPRIR